MWVFNVYLDNSFKLSRDVLVKKLAERKLRPEMLSSQLINKKPY